MSLLIDKLPNSVNVGGKDYEINTDFRVSVLFELLLLDEEVPDELKAEQAIKLYFLEPIPPKLYDEALKRIIDFYLCDKPIKEQGGGKSAKAIYSFEYDDDYIFSAFYQQYGIDLTKTKMHWWKFRALFKSLSEQCKIIDIMHYRATNIAEVPKERQKFYRAVQKLYALPISDYEQQRIKELEEKLMGGGC